MNSQERYSFSTLVDMEYRQVGGLMLWLCFCMVVVNPLECGFEIWRDMPRVRSFSVDPEEFLGHLIVYTAQGGLVVAGVVAGVLLWRLHPKGVLLVKLWFVTYFCFVFLLTVLSVVGGAMSGMAAEAWEFTWPVLLITFVKSGLWWLYLDRSYRVKRTYQLRNAPA